MNPKKPQWILALAAGLILAGAAAPARAQAPGRSRADFVRTVIANQDRAILRSLQGRDQFLSQRLDRLNAIVPTGPAQQRQLDNLRSSLTQSHDAVRRQLANPPAGPLHRTIIQTSQQLKTQEQQVAARLKSLESANPTNPARTAAIDRLRTQLQDRRSQLDRQVQNISRYIATPSAPSGAL